MQNSEIDPDGSGMSLHIEEATWDEVPDTGPQFITFEEAPLGNLLHEFVELVNARDFAAVGELLAPAVEAEFLDERSRSGVVEGLVDLVFRNPSLILTRGDLGREPVVAAWIYDPEWDRYDPFGYFKFQVSELKPLIERVDYVDEFSDPTELVVEEPQRSEIPEWDDWSQLDEG